VTAESQTERIARQKRAELLDGALEEVVLSGWRRLQMQAIAKRVGVSRQTVYNTFRGRTGLAKAMIEHLTDSFLDGFDAAFNAAKDPEDRWEAGVRYLLVRGGEDPALRAMLGPEAEGEFLALLTSGSEPIVERAQERIPTCALRHDPTLDRTRLDQVADLLTRLTLSEIVQPMHDVDTAALVMTEMVESYLAASFHRHRKLPAGAA
jgi:AcrR family transcriptional regulator